MFISHGSAVKHCNDSFSVKSKLIALRSAFSPSQKAAMTFINRHHVILSEECCLCQNVTPNVSASFHNFTDHQVGINHLFKKKPARLITRAQRNTVNYVAVCIFNKREKNLHSLIVCEL